MSQTRSRSTMTARRTSTLVAIGAVLLATMVAGCTMASSQRMRTVGSTRPAAMSGSTGRVVPASNVQTCLTCDQGKMPATVEGHATLENGVQVLSIAIRGGTYVPNTFAVKAGVPVKVVFAGRAKGCLAKPTFKSLGKQVDLTATDTGSVVLGPLAPGTYKFTCAMGMNGGTITAN